MERSEWRPTALSVKGMKRTMRVEWLCRALTVVRERRRPKHGVERKDAAHARWGKRGHVLKRVQRLSSWWHPALVLHVRRRIVDDFPTACDLLLLFLKFSP